MKLLAYISDKDLFAEFYRWVPNLLLLFWLSKKLLYYTLSLMLLLIGRSLHGACYLIRVPMMNMREVSWQSWSSNVVVNLLQKWRGWSVLTLLSHSWSANPLWFIFVCPFQLFQVTDLTLARENQTSFEEYLNNNSSANPGIDLTVTVLTTGFWPSYKSFDLNLPAEMVMLAHIAV